MAFYALECSTQVDAGNPVVCLGCWILPVSMRPFACWEPLALTCLLSPSRVLSQGCAHISGIWAGLLWGKMTSFNSAGGLQVPPVLRNGVLTRPAYARDDGGRRADAGHRLGRGDAWWARSPLLVHAGITAAVLVLAHVAASKTGGGRRDSVRTGSAATWRWPEWMASGSAAETRSSPLGGLWDYIIIDNTASAADARELVAGAAETARQMINALWV